MLAVLQAWIVLMPLQRYTYLKEKRCQSKLRNEDSWPSTMRTIRLVVWPFKCVHSHQLGTELWEHRGSDWKQKIDFKIHYTRQLNRDTRNLLKAQTADSTDRHKFHDRHELLLIFYSFFITLLVQKDRWKWNNKKRWLWCTSFRDSVEDSCGSQYRCREGLHVMYSINVVETVIDFSLAAVYH